MAIKAQGQITLSSVVDVTATYRYYLLQSSTLTAPSKPTTYPPASTWDDAEPSYTDGSTNSLYFVDCTVFCDDTFQYSAVSLSSSYEAAKTAYNKAVNAQDTANQTQANLDNLTIGGRNLLRNSDAEITNAAGATQAEFIYYADLEPIFAEYGLIEYTLSFDIKSADTTNASRVAVYCIDANTSRHQIGYHYIDVTTAYARHSFVFTPFIQDADATTSRLAFYGTYGTGNIPCVKNVKLEKGNKATDWTPAPEDLQEAADNAQATADSVQENLAENYFTKAETEAQITVESDSILSTVSATYADKSSVSTQINQLADKIEVIFAETDALSAADKEFNEQFATIYDYIQMSGGAITLGAFDANTGEAVPLTLRIAKEGIEFVKNGAVLGSWDGDNFYTGNIHVRVDERLQLGNFIALPRSDGSLMWLKAGG